ncbi:MULTISPECIES: nitric oxide reductase transcriptional regulator NorR [Halomonadaceae]|uniref:nitric oxide reductase transcriptional regulator NorR n=1 Tax=Halomonadaceae TaxID=28256 RepID=UPI001599915C|nr:MULTISPECIES: nitric oxide reductase transcriptional regulator NorR [Halomonas]QJQ96877.1 nitric oxide reductase transcriptional regulator NorR [Halomonas sp. PA5]
MTALLHTLQGLLTRLSEGQSKETLHEHWAQLLEVLMGPFRADASALLVVNEDGFRPIATLGLPDEVWGRCFTLEKQPRLATIALQPGVSRFGPDCTLSNPFDGLIDDTLSQIHDSIGVALRDGERLIGILTLDTLTPGQLEGCDEERLIAAANLLGTCLCMAARLGTVTPITQTYAFERQTMPLHWHSPAMRRLDDALSLVAPTDMNVLLHGETGVGKERIVQQLHTRSPRYRASLVRVNCAALPEYLIESELFGHCRGAFSGAVKDHRGHFAMADGGTLMLDEIGELPLVLQPKLLRVLQEGEIQPLGSERPQRVDVRVIAVTNRDLAAEVRSGRFREDLYHRLSVFPLEIPPLRERREDIPLLAGNFLEENRIRLGLSNLRLAQDAESALMVWHWPGNVRELEHTISRAALRALGDALQERRHFKGDQRQVTVRITQHHLDLPTKQIPHDLDEEVQSTLPATKESWQALRVATEDFQRHYIHRALTSHEDNWAATARALATDTGNLHRLGKRLGLK